MPSAKSSPASKFVASSSAQPADHQRLSLKRGSDKQGSQGKGQAPSRPKRNHLSYAAKAAVREAVRESYAAKFSQGSAASSPESAEQTSFRNSPDAVDVGKARDARSTRSNFTRGDFARGERNARSERRIRGERGTRCEGSARGNSGDAVWGQSKIDARRSGSWTGYGLGSGSMQNEGVHTGTQREVVLLSQVFESDVPVGKMVELPVIAFIEQGAMVDAGNLGHLFVPRSQLPDELALGDMLRVFIYNEGKRFCATSKRPYLQLGMTGLLKVSDVNNGTVYLSLGIPKDLVLPISEQRVKRLPRIGDNMLVLVAIDDQGRLYGSQSFNRFIRDVARPGEFKPHQSVKIVAVAHTPLGFRVIVDDTVYGLIYSSEQKGELIMGKRYEGFVKSIRPDGRLDVSLQQGGREGIEQASHEILQALGFSQGFLNFNDRSDPAIIEDYLHMSKGKFKKAIGALYKERLIELVDGGVKLTPKGCEAFEAEHGQKVVPDANLTTPAIADDSAYDADLADEDEVLQAAQQVDDE